ncbi:MAG TPA: TIGR00282 family metallophosphoesterase [Gemmatimonadota bacterium]|nr:TIGR00282 family metallophosphoesterase [Gemmatimonadota bacterium]
MDILFVADVFGRPGRRALERGLAAARRRSELSFVIVNGENAAGGFGLTPAIAREFLDAGTDVITSGNHIWDRREIYELLDSEPRVLRPDNYPPGSPGRGVWTGTMGDVPAAVLNLQGRVFMKEIDCPFRRLDDLLAREDVKSARIIVLDFHAEATAEKVAMGRYADGRVTAVIGTHTHVPSADACILPGGTAYVTDAGMTGPHGGVIGIKTAGALRRFLTQTPHRFEVAGENVRFQGLRLSVDESTGRAAGIERIDEPDD